MRFQTHHPIFVGVAIQLLAFPSVGAQFTWICSTNSQRWVDKGTLQSASGKKSSGRQIEITENAFRQEIDGWGGCFNELEWEALSALGTNERDAVIAALFDTVTGCALNLCRMPIGANDYAQGYYSLDDHADDFTMSYFSVARDSLRLIPFIKAAMKYRPDLQITASPWCPPTWMMTPVGSQPYVGTIKATPQIFDAYGLYLAKFVNAYRALGINIASVHVQNEPQFNNNNYPQCKWTGAQMRDFIKGYLGPQFRKNNVAAEICHGTIWNLWDDGRIPDLGPLFSK
jgi:glucosylceramidase